MLDEYTHIIQEINDTIKSFIAKLPEMLNTVREKAL